LYAKYQLFNYWQGVGTTIAIIFGILLFSAILAIGIAEDAAAPALFAALMLAFLIAGVIIYAINKYQIEVALKPEIARYVVPAGLDLAEKVSQEVSAMWYILKGVLSK